MIFYLKKNPSGLWAEFCHHYRRIIISTNTKLIRKAVGSHNRTLVLNHALLHEICHARVSTLTTTQNVLLRREPVNDEKEYAEIFWPGQWETVKQQEYWAERELRQLCRQNGWDELLEYSTIRAEEIISQSDQIHWDLYGWVDGARRILKET